MTTTSLPTRVPGLRLAAELPCVGGPAPQAPLPMQLADQLLGWLRDDN